MTKPAPGPDMALAGKQTANSAGRSRYFRRITAFDRNLETFTKARGPATFAALVLHGSNPFRPGFPYQCPVITEPWFKIN